jgi:large subunit ribosomal protein L24e
MAASREKQRAHRKKVLEKSRISVELHKPLEIEASESRVRDKIKISAKSSQSALVKGEGRSMGMDTD